MDLLPFIMVSCWKPWTTIWKRLWCSCGKASTRVLRVLAMADSTSILAMLSSVWAANQRLIKCTEKQWARNSCCRSISDRFTTSTIWRRAHFGHSPNPVTKNSSDFWKKTGRKSVTKDWAPWMPTVTSLMKLKAWETLVIGSNSSCSPEARRIRRIARKHRSPASWSKRFRKRGFANAAKSNSVWCIPTRMYGHIVVPPIVDCAPIWASKFHQTHSCVWPKRRGEPSCPSTFLIIVHLNGFLTNYLFSICRTWEEGKILIFDDSFEHEVWHNGTSVRVVFIVDVWHPDLTEEERSQLVPI